MTSALVPPRILIVKLSSLGDVVHALPVVADVHATRHDAIVDWVVEPAFAPLVERTRGVSAVLPCAIRRWRTRLWDPRTWLQIAAFLRRLRRTRYDAIVDLQGLTKSALVTRLARGRRYGLANRTEGAGYEPAARWLVDTPIAVPTRIHAIDRGRELARRALGTESDGRPDFGLRGQPAGDATAGDARPTIAFVHGTTRRDKLWPEANWIAIGGRIVAGGENVALPVGGDAERARAERIARAIDAAAPADGGRAEVWPAMDVGALVDRLAATAGVIGVDSGPSHIAVALDLPHVQLYNHATSWRTGPQTKYGRFRQVSVSGNPTPTVDAVWDAWCDVRARVADEIAA